jgi:hypothetical protein
MGNINKEILMEQVEQARLEKRQRIKDKAKRMIWVTFRKEGIHKYPAALNDPQLKTGDMYDVSFLGYPHRHIFHFTVGIQVWHNDRDVEFIQFKRYIEQLYSSNEGVLSLDYKSCEMISDDLYEQIASRYPDRDIEITVSEDGENGATIYYDTHQPYQQLAI